MTTTQKPETVVNLLEAFLEQAKVFTEEHKPIDPKYHVTAEFIEAPKDEVEPLLDEWRNAKKKVDAAKAKLEGIEAKIKKLMNGAEVLVLEETKQYVVESRVTVGQVFDTTRFKKEQPQLAADYQRDRYSRNFRILV